MPGPAKRSGLQQQVLNLYRACFRAARQKPAVGQTIVLFLQGLLLMLVTLSLFRKPGHGFTLIFAESFEPILSVKTILLPLNTCFGEDRNNWRHTVHPVSRISICRIKTNENSISLFFLSIAALSPPVAAVAVYDTQLTWLPCKCKDLLMLGHTSLVQSSWSRDTDRMPWSPWCSAPWRISGCPRWVAIIVNNRVDISMSNIHLLFLRAFR